MGELAQVETIKKYTFEEKQLPKYVDPELLKTNIQDYFANGCTMKSKTIKVKQEDGTTKEEKILVPVPTITGMALHLGFADRQSMYDYASGMRGKDGATTKEGLTRADIVKKAMSFIEREYEEMLQGGNVVGAIFALKNMGWSDKMEVTNNNVDVNQLRADSQKIAPRQNFGQVIDSEIL